MLFACSMACPFHDAETLSRFEEGTLGAIMRLAVVRLIGSVLRLHAFISASNTRNVLFMMEKVVYLPFCVFVMKFREIFSTTSTFVASTFLACALALPVHNVEVSDTHRYVAGCAHCRLAMMSLVVTFLRAQAFGNARFAIYVTRCILLTMIVDKT